MTRVVDSRFLLSARSAEGAPPAQHSEVVFVGRSNVGKSTLINLIVDSKGLAKSSATPGKTQLINYFETVWKREEERFSLWLVDLPGFGYAKVSKGVRNEWEEKLMRFLQQRSSIKLFMQLIDSRHPDLSIDQEAWHLLHSIKRGDQRILRVFTKTDKLSRHALHLLKKRFPGDSLVSMTEKTGMEQLRERMLVEVLGGEIRGDC